MMSASSVPILVCETVRPSAAALIALAIEVVSSPYIAALVSSTSTLISGLPQIRSSLA